jgi:hypothetical protein
MKCYKYKLDIYENACERVHGWEHQIEEIFSPDYNLCFNNLKGYFISTEPRNEVYEEIEIDRKFLSDLKTCAIMKASIEDQIQDFFSKKENHDL